MKDFSYGIVPIFKKGDEILFLLIQHLHEHGGHWAFPKGHMEDGESAIETAKRELFEEAGIRNVKIVDSPEFFEKYSFVQKDVPYEKVVKYFLGEVDDQKVKTQDEEINDFVWLKFEDAIEKITFSEGKQLLMDIGKFLDKIY
jgi:8-oxo-dGTP pyrophosphatase MutT (NUDIX family)